MRPKTVFPSLLLILSFACSTKIYSDISVPLASAGTSAIVY